MQLLYIGLAIVLGYWVWKQGFFDTILGGVLPSPSPGVGGAGKTPGNGNISSGVSAWSSAAWSNGKPRTLKGLQTDPHDKSFFVLRPGNPSVTIDGKGTATVNGTTPRIGVKGNWLNTNIQASVYWTTLRSITIHSRSNYSATDSTPESAYGSHFEPAGTTWIKKETPDGYSPRIASKSGVVIPRNQWTTIGQIVKDVSGGVQVENYVNGRLVTSAIDKGDWPNVGKPITRAGGTCYIRSNDGTNTKYRDFSISKL